MATTAAVVLAGGAGRRLGRPDKPLRTVGGTPMLARVLAAAAEAGADPRVVVGPPELAQALPRGVLLTQEDPPGQGPVAAAAAGITHATAGFTALLAADLPFLTAAAIHRLSTAIVSTVDGAVLVDDADRPQWLCGVWRTEPLRARLAEAEPGGSLRAVLTKLTVAYLKEPATEAPAWFDCDTEDDMRRAEEWVDGSAGGVDR